MKFKGNANMLLIIAAVVILLIAAGIIPLGSLIFQGCGGASCFDTIYEVDMPDGYAGDIIVKYECTETMQSGHPVTISFWNWDSARWDNTPTTYKSAAAQYSGGSILVDASVYTNYFKKIRIRMFEEREGSADPAFARSCKLQDVPKTVTSGCGSTLQFDITRSYDVAGDCVWQDCPEDAFVVYSYCTDRATNDLLLTQNDIDAIFGGTCGSTLQFDRSRPYEIVEEICVYQTCPADSSVWYGYCTDAQVADLILTQDDINFLFGEIQPPIDPDILSILTEVWNRIWSWIQSIFGWLSGTIIASGETAYPGDTFQHTFTLTNTLADPVPDDDYADGTRSWLYSAAAVFDTNGNVVQETQAEITAIMFAADAITLDVSYDIPDSPVTGKHAAAATLVLVEASYDRAAEAWTYSSPVEIDKQAAEFTVATIGEPEAPDITAIFQQIWASISSFLCSTFGIFC